MLIECCRWCMDSPEAFRGRSAEGRMRRDYRDPADLLARLDESPIVR